jgi:outer membrane murein-binding lipoprotein Lpp
MTIKRAAAVVAWAVLLAACSSGGVSRAEYDQKVAELALTQQDLLAERDVVAALESQLEGIDVEALRNQIAVLEGEVAQRDALAHTLIEEAGAVVDDRRTPIEQLAEIVLDGPPEDLNTADRLDAYLLVISLVAGLGFDSPPDPSLLEDIRPEVDRTLDMELTTRLDELIEAAGSDPDGYPAEALRFLQDAASFAMSVNAGGRPPG